VALYNMTRNTPIVFFTSFMQRSFWRSAAADIVDVPAIYPGCPLAVNKSHSSDLAQLSGAPKQPDGHGVPLKGRPALPAARTMTASSMSMIGHDRRWLILTTIGCALVVVAMIIVALVIADKPHFGWLVGAMFLPVITSGVMVGSLLLLVGAWNLPERKTWRGITLLVWGAGAVTSPVFGLMFLLPWGLLVLSLPLVIAILVGLFQRSRNMALVPADR
jgi:MFS family permease